MIPLASPPGPLFSSEFIFLPSDSDFSFHDGSAHTPWMCCPSQLGTNKAGQEKTGSLRSRGGTESGAQVENSAFAKKAEWEAFS